MFLLKKCAGVENKTPEVRIENLSSYDVNASINYSGYCDKSDQFMIRFVGRDDGSALELTVLDGLVCEVGLRCYEGKVDSYFDSRWTSPENIKNEVYSYRLIMDENNVKTKLGSLRIDQFEDFEFQIYSDAIVFKIVSREVNHSSLLDEKLVVLFDEASIVIGFVILSKEHASILSESYCKIIKGTGAA